MKVESIIYLVEDIILSAVKGTKIDIGIIIRFPIQVSDNKNHNGYIILNTIFFIINLIYLLIIRTYTQQVV